MANRTLQLLALFSSEPGVWTVDAMARELGVSASSAYRDVQELCRAGFLDPVTGAGYVLGPAFIEYDRLIRQGDTLVKTASVVMRDLLDRTTQSATAILCRRYRDTVMCVHQESGSAPHPITTYERGMAMPLFAGASSKVILANLDDRALKRVYLENEAVIRSRSGVVDWKSFKEELREIHRAGFVVTKSEVANGRAGIAAPVLVDRQVIAGVSLVLSENELNQSVEKFRDAVISAGQTISDAISSAETWVAR